MLPVCLNRTPESGHDDRVRIRRLLVVALITVVLILTGLVGGGWYYSSQMLALPSADTAADPVVVVAVRAQGAFGRITLAARPGSVARTSLVSGVEFGGGAFVRLSGAPTVTAGNVTRAATLIAGSWPALSAAGQATEYGWPAAPSSALGPRAEAITIPGETGAIPAWFVPGRGSTFVVFVHGRGATRRESMNVLHDSVAAGLPSVAVEYRGAPEGPPAPDHRVHFGLTEWHDLQTVIDYLRARRGATRVVLAGYSMGGAVIAQFLQHSSDSRLVTALILDAPLLDLHATLRVQARARSVPGPLIGPLLAFAETFASWRAGVDADQLDAIPFLASSRLPILLFQGTQDTTVSIDSARQLAHDGASHVSYHECAAPHVRCWNADPASYDEAVLGFLRTHG